jgi:integrase
MAWTQLRESGKYQGLYRTANGDIRSAGTFTQARQALREATRKEDAQREPGAVDPKGGRITWGAWFRQWHDSRSLAYSTDMTYRSTADCHILPFWEDTKLTDVDELGLNRWVKSMLHPSRRGVEPRSVWVVRNALMLMKTSLNAAVYGRRLAVSPAERIPYPDLPAGTERYLTPTEVENITFYMNGVNSLIVLLGVETGLRFGEISGLHWNRVDFDRGLIHVIEKFDQKARKIDPLPKDNEKRTVPVSDHLMERLAHYRENAAKPSPQGCGIAHVAGRCGGDILFRGARGAPIKSNDWGKTVWATALKLGGVEGRVRPHDMRHTYASWLLQQGVSLPELALMMGHSSWEVTKKYAHLSSTTYDTVRDAISSHRRGAERGADSRYAALRVTPDAGLQDAL